MRLVLPRHFENAADVLRVRQIKRHRDLTHEPYANDGSGGAFPKSIEPLRVIHDEKHPEYEIGKRIAKQLAAEQDIAAHKKIKRQQNAADSRHDDDTRRRWRIRAQTAKRGHDEREGQEQTERLGEPRQNPRDQIRQTRETL